MTTATTAAVISRSEASGIARLRCTRMSMLSRTPVIGPWLGTKLWPWTWSLSMVTLARQRIERDPGGASLALIGSTRGEAVSPDARRAGLATYLSALLFVTLVVSLSALAPSPLAAVVGVLVAGIAIVPLVLEVIALLLNMLIRPGQLFVGRRRRQLIKQGQHAVILTDYVRDASLPKGSGQKLLERLAVGWADDRTIVLLYPANRALQRMYAERGAVSDSRWTRRMRFDYSQGCLDSHGPSGEVG